MEKIKSYLKTAWSWVDDSPSFVRWTLLAGVFLILAKVAGFDLEEFRVTILIVWYSILSTIIASFMTYAYGKVNYHRAKTDPVFIQAQVEIFKAVYQFSGLVILGTYIAQYN